MPDVFTARRRVLSQSQAAFVLLLPFLLCYGLFLVYPFLRGFWISLHNWNLLAVAFNPDAKEFVGFDNYRKFLWGRNIEWSVMYRPLLQGLGLIGCIASLMLYRRRRIGLAPALLFALFGLILFILPGFHPGAGGRWNDRRFWPTVGTTMLFVGLTVPGITVLALFLAVLLNRETRIMTLLRTLFFISQVLSVTVVTLIWQLMFSPSQGLIANVARLFGTEPLVWLTNEKLAMIAIVITTIWWAIGIAMILFLAGLQDISQDIYEAAALDNAKGWRAFWHITLPNLRRTITLVVVLQIIMHFQVFGQAQLMTGGGPNDATNTLVRHIYQTGFRDSELGRASAMAIFLFVVMGTFSLLQFVLGREGKDA